MQRGFGGAEWFSTASNGTFSLSATEALVLSARCPPIPEQSSTINTNPIPLRPIIGGGGGGGRGVGIGGGFSGGGDFGGWSSFDYLRLILGGGGGSVSVHFNGELTVL